MEPVNIKVFPQFQSASSGVEFQLISSYAVMFLIQYKETVRMDAFFACQDFICSDEITRCLLSPMRSTLLASLIFARRPWYFVTRCSAIAERPRCRVRYSFGQKWKTGTERRYFTDNIGLSSTTVV